MTVAIIYSPLPGYAASLEEKVRNTIPEDWTIRVFQSALDTQFWIRNNCELIGLLLIDETRKMLGDFDAYSRKKLTDEVAIKCQNHEWPVPRIAVISFTPNNSEKKVIEHVSLQTCSPSQFHSIVLRNQFEVA